MAVQWYWESLYNSLWNAQRNVQNYKTDKDVCNFEIELGNDTLYIINQFGTTGWLKYNGWKASQLIKNIKLQNQGTQRISIGVNKNESTSKYMRMN